jgi:hypothetical protein
VGESSIVWAKIISESNSDPPVVLIASTHLCNWSAKPGPGRARTRDMPSHLMCSATPLIVLLQAETSEPWT